MKYNYLKFFLIALISAIGLLQFMPAPSSFAANNICGNNNVVPEVRNAAGCNNNSDKLPKIITNILKSIIGVSGIVAVIFIVIGGINYMTSSGDSAKVEKAKKTILYACIGLIICALAFAIVNWTIGIV